MPPALPFPPPSVLPPSSALEEMEQDQQDLELAAARATTPCPVGLGGEKDESEEEQEAGSSSSSDDDSVDDNTPAGGKAGGKTPSTNSSYHRVNSSSSVASSVTTATTDSKPKEKKKRGRKIRWTLEMVLVFFLVAETLLPDDAENKNTELDPHLSRPKPKQPGRGKMWRRAAAYLDNLDTTFALKLRECAELGLPPGDPIVKEAKFILKWAPSFKGISDTNLIAQVSMVAPSNPNGRLTTLPDSFLRDATTTFANYKGLPGAKQSGTGQGSMPKGGEEDEDDGLIEPEVEIDCEPTEFFSRLLGEGEGGKEDDVVVVGEKGVFELSDAMLRGEDGYEEYPGMIRKMMEVLQKRQNYFSHAMAPQAVAQERMRKQLDSDELLRHASMNNTLAKKREREEEDEDGGEGGGREGNGKGKAKRRRRKSAKEGDMSAMYDNETGTNLIDSLGGIMREGEEGAKQAAASELAFKKEHAERQMEIETRAVQADETVAASLSMLAAAMAGRGGGAPTAEEKEEARLEKLRDQNTQYILRGIAKEEWPGPNYALYMKEKNYAV